jgi:hypothetical protein
VDAGSDWSAVAEGGSEVPGEGGGGGGKVEGIALRLEDLDVRDAAVGEHGQGDGHDDVVIERRVGPGGRGVGNQMRRDDLRGGSDGSERRGCETD